jgi:hypothetical protein
MNKRVDIKMLHHVAKHGYLKRGIVLGVFVAVFCISTEN